MRGYRQWREGIRGIGWKVESEGAVLEEGREREKERETREVKE
jgi:hypothetical protein